MDQVWYAIEYAKTKRWSIILFLFSFYRKCPCRKEGVKTINVYQNQYKTIAYMIFCCCCKKPINRQVDIRMRSPILYHLLGNYKKKRLLNLHDEQCFHRSIQKKRITANLTEFVIRDSENTD